MARLIKKAELFSHVREVGYMRELTTAHGDTTLTAAAAKGASTLTVAAITNLADGDYLLIGAAESMEVAQISGAPSGNTVTLRSTLALAHVIGETVKECGRTNLGDVTDDGLTLAVADGDFNAVMAATRRQVAGFLMGHIMQGLEFAIEHLNLENLAAAVGMAETQITGAGSPANPSKLDLVPDNFGTDIDAAWYFLGLRKDGQTVELQAWGVEVDPTAVQGIKFARGAPAPIPFRIRPTSGLRCLLYT